MARGLAGLVVALLGVASVAEAARLDVPADYPDLATAVLFAQPGDEIVLADGVWTGPGFRDVVVDKALTIRSSGDPTKCVIDLEHQGRGLITVAEFDHFFELRLRNLTFINGYAPRGEEDPFNSEGRGGALLVTGFGPMGVDRCVFSNNRAEGAGGAAFVWGAFQDSHFENNSSAVGGAVALFGDGFVYRCTFLENEAANAGGALALLYTSSTSHLQRCKFERNRTLTASPHDDPTGFIDDALGGGALFVGGLSRIIDCEFVANASASIGGALSLRGVFGERATVLSSEGLLFAGNRAEEAGGAMSISGRSWFGRQSYRLTFHGNRAPRGSAIAITEFSDHFPTGSKFSTSILWNGVNPYYHFFHEHGPDVLPAGFRYSCVQGHRSEERNVFDYPPEFVRSGYWDDAGTPDDETDDSWVHGDYRLQPDSPYVDPEWSSASTSPTYQQGDGGIVPWDGDNDGIAKVDYGYRELGPVYGDLNCDGQVDFLDIDPFVESLLDRLEYRQQFPDCDERLADLHTDYRVDFFDIDPFVERLLAGE